MEKLLIGTAVNTHGIRGEVKINPCCDLTDQLLTLKKVWIGETEYACEGKRMHKNCLLVKLKGVDDMNAAEGLKGLDVFADKKHFRLKKGVFFIEDLIGLTVKDADTGKEYGKITDVMQTGANDVYTVSGEKEFLIPAIKECIIETDVSKGIMLIRPLEGLLDL